MGALTGSNWPLPAQGEGDPVPHTYARLLLAREIHVKIVSRQLGHRTVSVTLNLHSQLLPSIQEQAA